MEEIKIDVEFIITQTDDAKEALENMLYYVDELQKHIDMVEQMKTEVFISEFEDRIMQITDEVINNSKPTIENIIKWLTNLSANFEQEDNALAKM